MQNNAENYIKSIKNIPGVVSAADYSHNLTGRHGGLGGLYWPEMTPSRDMKFANLEVGPNFLQTAGIQLKEGRFFSPDSAALREIIFNESAIRDMGFKDPIGKTITLWGRKKVVIGVARDFHFESLYETVKPCIFQVYFQHSNVMVRMRAGTEQQTISRLKQVYQQFNPGIPFDYQFLDEDYQALYASEKRMAVLSRYFAGLAIIISCLGLFGLAAFTAQRRQKEIGIRKVVGATVSNIVLLLSRDFLKLVILSVLIAFPLVWWAMNKWLDAFAYRIPIGVTVFLLAGILILLITLLTISFQAIKAALTNPVKSLRAE
jgi:ABC-type antimicrobial peptide transport system permease subunit